MKDSPLNTEWTLLQNQYDSYEKHALYIKLVSFILWVIALSLNLTPSMIGLLLATLWLQEAIWKTFQCRIEKHLLQLEHAIANNKHDDAFQFHSHY